MALSKVVGVGSCCVDYLASVSSFPRPDQKMRSETLEVQGGGNTANACTCAARLGLHSTLLTKIGSDGLGDGVVKELERDGVDVSYVQRANEGCSTPFTYIIVDKEGGTRTCIHSPSPGTSMGPEDIEPEMIDLLLDGAKLVFFDGRLTEAALIVAEKARELGIPILVEGERKRENLDKLLAYGDIIVTSKNYPSELSGLEDQADAIAETFLHHPLARMMITTLGSKGSLMLIRDNGEGQEESRRLGDVMAELQGQMAPPLMAIEIDDGSVDCTTRKGVKLIKGCTASTSSAVVLQVRGEGRIRCWVVRSKAASVFNGEGLKDDGLIIDTTGAGDAFIGALVYSLTQLKDMLSGPELLERSEKILQLSGVVSAAKCTEVGARPGLPLRGQISPNLL